MSIESFLKKQPRWLQLLIAFTFLGLCILVIVLKAKSSFADEPVEEPKAKSIVTFDVGGLEDDAAEEAKVLLEAFAKQCRVEEYAPDIESIKARIEDPYPFTEEKKWPYQITLEMKISDDPKVIPNEYRAWGHTCHFSLGSNEIKAGMFLSKSPCQSICQTGSDYLTLPVITKEAGIRLKEFNNNVNYISSISGVEPEGVIEMLTLASKMLAENKNIQLSQLEISRWLYKSEDVSKALKTKTFSLAEVLALYVQLANPLNDKISNQPTIE
ncbi:MAG: hypothetical protein ACTH58_07960 [Marinomonas foliarum]|uniref:hypothetical protein n=1 Tax=Marinomonas foliarum TaxID=491950 RepID=UPI003F95131C